MTKSGWMTSLLVLALSLAASSAGAQDPNLDPEWSDDPYVRSAPDRERTPSPTNELPQEGVQRKFNWAMTIGVPVWLRIDKSLIRPGADISWVGGFDIGYVVFSLGAGVMFTPVDLKNYVDENGNSGSQSPLTRLYFFPEIRFQLPNDSLVLPYLTGAFDVNWWNFRETGLRCGFWICSTSSVYRFTPGFTGKVGLAFEIKRGVKFDLGMKYSLTGKGDFFAQSRWWLTPYVGVLVRRKVR
jgi:opacity protein-like surface antigen